ncbi:MAG TPA: cytochrome c3 family protein [Anaeromyxobacteraceae bacterium]|nr:cytochrome c3 family protein [Anaeromyxobacteraceae bacterium]
MQRFAWWGAILSACLLSRPALAQRMGDPTPGSQAPLVALVNPMDGAIVGQRIRVQARVQHPAGLGAVASVTLSVAGASSFGAALSLNPAYALAPDTGIYEAIVSLAPGGYALVATAVDTAGLSTNCATVSVTANAGLGDGNLLVRDNSSQLCTSCHALWSHGSETAGRTYGAWTTTCRDCHVSHRTRNVYLVRETITPPWVTDSPAPQPKAVRLAGKAGYAPAGGDVNFPQASFANGDGTGPCQVCHTRTVRWRSGGAPDAIHLGNCAFCHLHQQGFKARCGSCHPAPPTTGAHLAHHGASSPTPPFPSDPRPLGCGSCHPTDPALHGDGVQQVVLNQDLTLPGGTRTAGAQLSGTSTGTTCLVACHYPLGAPVPAQPVTWSTVGPLPCTSCHSSINPGGAAPTPRAGPSLHDPVFSEARPASGEPTTCWSCHDPAGHDASHLTGAPALAATAAVDATCLTCHSPPSGPAAGPQGQVLHRGADPAASRTPPKLPGWSTATVDASTGDFHGGRRGTCFDPNAGPQPCPPGVTPTGYGGTLQAPYYRGYPPIGCAVCHAGHASQNAFLFAPVVNGVPVPPGSIDRAGVGAENLCSACHLGDRHERCKACHTASIICPDGQCYMDPTAPPVDPAPPGSACFWCHGHEGILQWTEPYSGQNMVSGNCAHCHGFVMPATRYASPALSGAAPRVTGITAAGATIAWQTDESASGYVEYGVGMPGYVAGSATDGGLHVVALTGLAPGTTYVWRVRSADAFRNVLSTGIASFTTTAAGAVPFPDLVSLNGWAGAPAPANTAVVNLQWYPVTAPSGNPVEYRVQLASDPGFTALVNGSPPDSGWIPGTPGTVSGKPVLGFPVTLTNLPYDQSCSGLPPNQYYWRVQARDSVSGSASDWSAVDPFQAMTWDPYGC